LFFEEFKDILLLLLASVEGKNGFFFCKRYAGTLTFLFSRGDVFLS